MEGGKINIEETTEKDILEMITTHLITQEEIPEMIEETITEATILIIGQEMKPDMIPGMMLGTIVDMILDKIAGMMPDRIQGMTPDKLRCLRENKWLLVLAFLKTC